MVQHNSVMCVTLSISKIILKGFWLEEKTRCLDKYVKFHAITITNEEILPTF